MIIWFLLLIFGKRQDLFQNHFKVFHNGTEFMVFGTHKKIEKFASKNIEKSKNL